MNRTSIGLLVVIAVGFLPLTAPADDKGLKERMEELHRRREERRKEAREQAAQGGAPGHAGAAATAKAGAPSAQGGAKNQGQGGAAGKAQGGAAGARAGAGGAGDASALEALRTTRADRRKATLDRLRARWGALLGDVRAREELRVHGERLAELQRIRSLAVEKKKLKVIEEVDTLLTKEELRHSNTMNALRDGAAAAAPKP